MTSSKFQSPLVLALGTALSLGSAAVSASPFEARDLGTGYAVAMAGDKGAEMACGEGGCGHAADSKDAKTDPAKKDDKAGSTAGQTPAGEPSKKQ